MRRIKLSERPKFKRRITPCESEEVKLTEHECLHIKESGYRQALNQAWFATALEQTKSVFTLASAGVGLSLTLIFSDGMKKSCSWIPIWLFLAVISFALSAWFCVLVFRINGKLVQKLVLNKDASDEDGLVGRIDWSSRTFFALGIAFLVLAAVAQIWL